MIVDTTLTLGNIITIVCGISVSIATIFMLWFKNQTAKFVTMTQFEVFKNLVVKVENEQKMQYQTIDLRLKGIEESGKLKHDYLVKELEHINSNVKNSDRSYEIVNKVLNHIDKTL